MPDEIRSIYDKRIDDIKPVSKDISSYNQKMTPKYEKYGVREKLADISQIEGRLPVDAVHAGFVKYIYSNVAIINPFDVLRIIAKTEANSQREHVNCILMNDDYFPLAVVEAGLGNSKSTVINIEEILKMSLMCGATKVIMAHNHNCLHDRESKHYAPSDEDYISFANVRNKLSLFDIDVIDSVIISENISRNDKNTRTTGIYSIKEQTLYTFKDSCETVVNMDYKRKKDTDHSLDFDENGIRVRHKTPVLTENGVDYEPDYE